MCHAVQQVAEDDGHQVSPLAGCRAALWCARHRCIRAEKVAWHYPVGFNLMLDVEVVACSSLLSSGAPHVKYQHGEQVLQPYLCAT